MNFSEAHLNGLTNLSDIRGFIVSEVAVPARQEWESMALSQGIPLAASDLVVWENAGRGPRSTLCTIHDKWRKLVGGFAIHHWPIKTLPGHGILRLEQFGEAIPSGAEKAVIAATLALARRLKRILRVDVEIFDRDHDRRARLSDSLRRANFHILENVRTYEKTLVIDLQHSDEDLLKSFSVRARRQIRLAERYPILVSLIEDEALIPQLEAIRRETYVRTGGRAPALSWTRLISSARASPDRIRIFGAFLAGDAAEQRLVAYAVVLGHGTFVQYDAAGSTRLPECRIPLMYPVIWELMRWARENGKTWFDFGGITGGSSRTDNDPFGGISKFKRNFGGEQQTVGENWRFDIAPFRQRMVSIANKLVSVLRLDTG